MINVTKLRSFWMVAKTGSFRLASEQLHVSQPALTRQVKDLEIFYGVELLTRSSSGSVPTGAGKQLFERANVIFQQLEQADSFLRNKTANRLSIQAVSHASLPTIIRQLKEQLDVSVDVTIAPSLEIESALLREECDMGLLTLDTADSEDFDTQLIGSYNLLCSVPKDHALNAESRISVQDLDNEPVVISTTRTQTRRVFENRLSELGLQSNVVFEIDCRQSLIKIARDMNVIGVFSDTGFEEEITHDARVFVEGDMTIPVYLAAHKNRLTNSLSDGAFNLAAQLIAKDKIP